ncbi:MAG: HAD family hydrolase [Gemmatimonadota bacterium]|nr:HAD family hydrolase [Gemmatimonadota bacterium]
MKIVLFDIDGTLLHSDGAGRRAIQRALVETYGTAGPEEHWFDGKTDPQIVHELMALAGVDAGVVSARLDDVFERYVELLREELLAPGFSAAACAGVPELLDALEVRDDVVLGLLTGNVQPGAHAKLGAVGIVPSRFRVGAFGSDHGVRAELPAIALARARHLLGRDVAGESMVVIGDTPADVTCGRAVRARSVGVATGRYSMRELREHGPAAVLPDFRDTAAAVSAILAG